jgi:NAD(P)H-quinone oxidoreductase subunit 6
MSGLSVPDLVFYGTALATVFSAAYAVFSRNLVRAVFALLGTFFGVAVIYGLLAADFVAVIQLMVYVGGILVLLLFAVMLTSQISQVERSNRSGSWLAGISLGSAVLILLVGVALKAPWHQVARLPEAMPTTTALGETLAGPLLLPFVLVGLVLLGAVIGAVTLARKKSDPEAS